MGTEIPNTRKREINMMRLKKSSCGMVFILSVCLPAGASADSSQVMARPLMPGSSSNFWYDVSTLKISKSGASAKIAAYNLENTQQTSAYDFFEFDCKQQTTRVNYGAPSDVKPNGSVLSGIHYGFCGFIEEGSDWRLVGIAPQGNFGIFIDANSVRDDSNIYESGMSLTFRLGSSINQSASVPMIEHHGNKPTHAHLSCGHDLVTYEMVDSSLADNRVDNGTEMKIENTLFEQLQFLLCNKTFPAGGLKEKSEGEGILESTMAVSSSKRNRLDQAKSVCLDLGFVEQTENYGNCVLRMMGD